MTDGYNGWKNYETWAVALWIDNDEGTYETRSDLVEQWIEETENGGTVSDLVQPLRDWVEETMIPDLGASLAADLLGAAMSAVDWHEIAKGWIEEGLAEVLDPMAGESIDKEIQRRQDLYFESLRA